MVRKLEKKSRPVAPHAGSALVLVIVITVLLATVGVMFVVMARLSQSATSAISDNRELSAAVDVVVNRIQTVLVDDLFGADDRMFNGPGDSNSVAFGDEDEYYDYPGPDDPWLANLEPYEFAPGDYYWPHISDIYGIMGIFGWYVPADIAVEPPDVNDLLFEGVLADADGDGVTDSRWVSLPVTSSKGRPIFAAVRIIDNCGMININTAYRDPTDPCDLSAEWDGSLLTHINLDTDRNVHDPCGIYYGFLSYTDRNLLPPSVPLSTLDLHWARCGGVLVSDQDYHNDVARRLLNPEFGYVPFDIGDELEFRNRFFLFSPVLTRSGTVWPVTFNPDDGLVGVHIPYDDPANLPNWFDKATSPEISTDPCNPRRICNRRHITTTYSFDRTVRPYDDTPLPGDMLPTSGQRKFGIQLPPNIEDGTALQTVKDQYIRRLAGAIYRGLPGDTEIASRFGQDYTREKLSWQFAVNLIDYQDDDRVIGNPDDDEPTYYALDDGSGLEFWGVENVECIKDDTIFISEVAYVNVTTAPPPLNSYYAIELFNPHTTRAKILSAEDYVVVVNGGSGISLANAFANSGQGNLFDVDKAVVLTNDSANVVSAFSGSIDPFATIIQVNGLSFDEGDEIVVYKEDWPTSGADMPVDSITVPPGVVDLDGVIHTAERNETLGPVSDNLLWTDFQIGAGELGTVTGLAESDPNMHVQLAVTNEPLHTIGEIENVFAVGYDPNDHTLIGSIEEAYILGSAPELTLDMRRYGRISLADPDYWGLLDFLTYFDPSSDNVDNNGDGWTDEPTELAVAGRININTAPWFVIKHLPWLGLATVGTDTDNLAQAIVAWRDGLDLTSLGGPDYLTSGRSVATGLTEISEEPGFRSIGELLQVINTSGALDFDIRKYLDGGPLNGPPDFSTDIVDDDFEERDIIFQRISNLVTVRSDVFTAYILVRIGHDGPKKRMIAIFDRSGVYSPADKPRLVALHPVPDPR